MLFCVFLSGGGQGWLVVVEFGMGLGRRSWATCGMDGWVGIAGTAWQ